jgi:hypothetical protein
MPSNGVWSSRFEGLLRSSKQYGLTKWPVVETSTWKDELMLQVVQSIHPGNTACSHEPKRKLQGHLGDGTVLPEREDRPRVADCYANDDEARRDIGRISSASTRPYASVRFWANFRLPPARRKMTVRERAGRSKIILPPRISSAHLQPRLALPVHLLLHWVDLDTVKCQQTGQACSVSRTLRESLTVSDWDGSLRRCTTLCTATRRKGS